MERVIRKRIGEFHEQDTEFSHYRPSRGSMTFERISHLSLSLAKSTFRFQLFTGFSLLLAEFKCSSLSKAS